MTATTKQAEITRKLRGALTVAELIEHLEGCNPEALVLFACDYGDYHHTQQALLVREVTDPENDGQMLVTSAYSHSGLAVEYKDDEDYEAEDSDSHLEKQPIVILTADRQ